MDNISQLTEKLNPLFSEMLELTEDGQAIKVSKDNVVKLIQTLKETHKYNMLVDISAVDYEDRYEIVYHLMAIENAEVIRVKVMLPKDSPRIPSIVSLWKAADVQEREAYDLFGIIFEGHGNLKRIFLPEEFVGHPLRKDFKVETISRF